MTEPARTTLNRNTGIQHVMRKLKRPSPIGQPRESTRFGTRILNPPVAIARHVATHPTNAVSQHHPDSAHIQHMRGLYTVLAGNIKNRGTSANQPAVEGQSAKGKNTRNRVGKKFIAVFHFMKYLRTEHSKEGSLNK